MTKKITLDIVTGFLGAGKTTFVQAMLRELDQRRCHGVNIGKVVYVVNEFGQAGIDASILTSQKVLSFELAGGCICCNLKADFSVMLQQIVDDHHPDRIIFEPSGLFILSELFSALSGEPYSDRLQIGRIITLLDARNHAYQSSSLSPLLQNQAQLADLLVISKLQVKPDQMIEPLVNIQLNFPDQPLLVHDAWNFTAEDWQLVLDQDPRPLRQVRFAMAQRLVRFNLLGSHQHPKLGSLTIPLACFASRDEIEVRLTHLVGGQYGDIIRVKGFVRCENQSWLIQMVRDQIDWIQVSDVEKSRLVIIGDTLQIDRIKNLFLS